VRKFHYFIASLNNEAKDLISNLQITNENFLVAWQLVTQRYNNKRLIAMMHAKHLCQMPQVKQGDSSSLCQLINHVSSHMYALQALSLNVPVQDLMLNHLMLATLDNDTHQQWELNTASRAKTPTTAEFNTFLEVRCIALELIQNTQSPSTVTTNPQATTQSTKTATTNSQRQQSAGSKFNKPLHCYVATQTQCTLCNGSQTVQV
jgi:diphosphomevalonate decarboxylase